MYIPPVLHPDGKACDGVHIVAGGAVEQGHRRLVQHKGIFSESLIVLRSGFLVLAADVEIVPQNAPQLRVLPLEGQQADEHFVVASL